MIEKFNSKEFLMDSFSIEEDGDKNLVQLLTSISNRTKFQTVEPSSIKIISLTRIPTEDEDEMQVAILNPAYADARIFEVRKDSYFAPEKGNFGSLPFKTLLSQGVSYEAINDIVDAGYFLQIADEYGTVTTLIPSKGFMATFCKQLGFNKIREGIDPMRDLFLASRLALADPFKLVYRRQGKFAKVFAAFSDKFCDTPQTIVLEFKDSLMRNFESASVRHWEYNHSITSIDFSLNKEKFKLGNMQIIPGIRLSLSDIGDCAYTLQSVFFCNGTHIILPNEVVRKRSRKMNVAEMTQDFADICLPQMRVLRKEMEKSMNSNVANVGAECVKLLSNVDFASAAGQSQSRTIFEFLETEYDYPGSGADVAIALLRLPGKMKVNNVASCLQRASITIGSVFSTKEWKKLCV